MFIRKSKHNHIVKELNLEITRSEKKAGNYMAAWERMSLLCTNAINEAKKLLIQNEYLASQLRLADIRDKGITFSQDEIRTLIRLCHPDKHNDSDSATTMTQRLLELRK